MQNIVHHDLIVGSFEKAGVDTCRIATHGNELAPVRLGAFV